MYLTYDEFQAQFSSLTQLVGGELKKTHAQRALQHAQAHLDAQLAQRYAVPLDLPNLPASTQTIVKRWMFYLALRELLASNAVVISRQENDLVPLTDLLTAIDDQIDSYCTGSRVLQGVPDRPRVYIGFGTRVEG